MTWKEFGRKRWWTNRGHVSVVAEGVPRKPRKLSVCRSELRPRFEPGTFRRHVYSYIDIFCNLCLSLTLKDRLLHPHKTNGNIILGKWPTWCTITLYNTLIIIILYMFRATLCSSSGGQIVLIQHLYSILCKWPSGVQVEKELQFLLNLHAGRSLTQNTIPDTVLTFWRRNYFFKF